MAILDSTSGHLQLGQERAVQPIPVPVHVHDVHIDIRVPPFVGDDYFCESGVNEAYNSDRHHLTFHSTDTLWDGEDCLTSSTCCSQHNPPYFIKQLPTPTTDAIEARICLRWHSNYSNVALELVELYVQ